MTSSPPRRALAMGEASWWSALCGRPHSPLRQRLVATWLIYAGLLLLALVIRTASLRMEMRALSLAIAFPGGGFLGWLDARPPFADVAPYLTASSLLLFAASVALWFATGNILLPAIVWLTTAVFATALPATLFPHAVASNHFMAAAWLPAAILSTLAIAACISAFDTRRRSRWRENFEGSTVYAVERVLAEPAPTRDEIGGEDMQRLRLLLDRALQPVDRFDGFEWIDQFQTAAVRYQVNFVSYALSTAAGNHLPAFEGYLLQAQRNLAAKQLDHRVWRYWQLENLWGNLSANRDPIARDNIMFSGFLAAQIALARSTMRLSDYDGTRSLALSHPSGAAYCYSLPEITGLLARRYTSAPLGLLACEPNWIYPLCNIMTASAIRAADEQFGSRHWDRMAGSFRKHLESDFTSADGRLMSFRSGLTGLGSSRLGGVIMQALPCLFLNAILPDVAHRQWRRVRHDLTGPRRQRHLWPLDVGNYRLTRASSLAATAAAAVELGDKRTAQSLLDQLDSECPLRIAGGIAYRPGVSVLSHAAEVMARLGRADGLRRLVECPRPFARSDPFIKSTTYPDVLVAAAHSDRGTLRAVLHPGSGDGFKPVTFAGLNPSGNYLLEIGARHSFTADPAGEATLQIPLHGRTEVRILPAD